MAKQIKKSEVFQPDLFSTDEAEGFLKILENILDEFKKIAKQTKQGLADNYFDSFENIQKGEKDMIALEKALAEVQKLEKEQVKLNKKLADQRKKQLEQNAKLKKQIDDLKKERTAGNKTQKEVNKLTQKIVELQTKEAEQAAKLKVQISELTKEQRKEAREQLGLVGAYERASKSLIELKKRYKDLAVEEKGATEEARNLKVEIDALDKKLKDIDSSVGDNSRRVGSYKEAIKEAAEETGILGRLTANLTSLQKIHGGVTRLITILTRKKNRTQKESIVLTQGETAATKKLTFSRKILIVVTKALRAAAVKLNNFLSKSIIGIVIIGLAAIGSLLSKTQGGLDGISKAISQVSITIDVIVGRFARLGSGLSDIFGAIGSFFSLDFEEAGRKASRGIDKMSGSFTGMGDEIAKAVKKAGEIADLENKLRDFIIDITDDIARFNAEAEKQAAIADDSTRGFFAREKAAKAAFESSKEALALELLIAQEQKKIANEKLKNKPKNTRTSNDFQALLDAELAFIEAEKNIALADIENQKRINELRQDRLEQRLDLEIDGFDALKNLNEKFIDDERQNLNDRKKVLEDTVKLNADSLSRQIDIFRKFGASREQIINVLQSQDTKELVARAEALGLSEIVTNRLREVFIEQSNIKRDFIDATRTLNDAELVEIERAGELTVKALDDNFQTIRKKRSDELKADLEDLKKNSTLSAQAKKDIESSLRAAEKRDQDEINANEKLSRVDAQEDIDKAVIDQKVADFEEEKDFEKFKQKEILKIQIEAIKKRLEAISQLEGEEFEVMREQLKGQLALLESQLANIGKDAEEEAFKRRIKKAEELAQALIDIEQKALDERISLIDKEIQARQDRSRRFEELADKQAEKSDENLAFEQKRIAEAEREREKQEKKKAQLELLSTAFARYNQAVQSGDKNPLATTIKDLTLLTQAIKSISSFYVGTEDTGKAQGGGLDGKGGRLSILHDNERVLTKKQNSELGKDSNDDVVRYYKLGRQLQDGAARWAEHSLTRDDSRPLSSEELIVKGLVTLNKTMSQLPDRIDIPEDNYIWDEVEKAMLHKIKKRNKQITNHYKQSGGLF